MRARAPPLDRRRRIAVALGLAWACAPRAVLAQRTPSRPARIGYLDTSSARLAGVRLDRLRAGLHELGYVEGKNLALEARWADSAYERLPLLAAELLELKLDLIVAAGPAAIQVARQATTTLPIVFVASGDPLVFGFVSSLSRPGGNITGVSSVGADLSYKYLEMLREAIPSFATVAVLINPGHPGHADYLRNIHSAAGRDGVRVLAIQAANTGQIEAAFGTLRQGGAGALIVLGDGLFFSQARRIAELAVRQRVPTLFSNRDPVQAGGLMSYGPNLGEQFHRAATYVDKIVRGAHPGDLPVEQPTTFELVINLQTARAIGLNLRQELLLRADLLIE